MKKFVILADATCDLSPELKERFKIDEIIETTVTLPDESNIKVDTTWPIDQDKFYQDLKNKKKYVTGAPSPDRFKEAFKKYASTGVDVLLLTISSGLSATYNFAKEAADEVNSKGYEGKIYVVDSMRYSTAELLLLIFASNYREEGKSIEETIACLENDKHHLHQAGPMDDLMYLARAGRISAGKAFMGTLVGVNPIGEINRNGITQVLCKVKGSKKALQTAVDYAKETIVDPQNQIVIVANSNRKEKAKMLEQMIREQINPREIIVTDIGLACAPNVGPGLCACYYYGTELSEDLSKEKAIFDKITAK